jgi:hypothetical protein
MHAHKQREADMDDLFAIMSRSARAKPGCDECHVSVVWRTSKLAIHREGHPKHVCRMSDNKVILGYFGYFMIASLSSV